MPNAQDAIQNIDNRILNLKATEQSAQTKLEEATEALEELGLSADNAKEQYGKYTEELKDLEQREAALLEQATQWISKN